MIQGRVSILCFPSQKNDCLIYSYFLSTSLNCINCLPICNIIQVRLALNAFSKRRRNNTKVNSKSKRFAGLSSCSILSPRADSYDVFGTHRMLLHHTPRLKRFHGLLLMRSCTVCPCFKITVSVSQLASSTGWFFHFTRYSKYCFLLVFLPTLLSSMHSI
jgi:hypothetical protein